jgi:hypothetical protein
LGDKKMSLLDKLKKKKQELQQRLQDNMEYVEQKRAENLRKKINKTKYLEPGTIRYGLVHKQSFNDFVNDTIERRKQQREKNK